MARDTFHGYLLNYPSNKQPVYIDEAGSILAICGILVQGQGVNILLVSPNGSHVDEIKVVHPSVEEWSEFLRRSDDPVFYAQDPGGYTKIIHRKAEYAVSGAVQQKIWVRDLCRCMYCGKTMGDVQLTVDHFVPLSAGGKNDDSNYLSACRRCNRNKGELDPREFCESNGYDYDGLYLYLEGRCSREFIAHLN